MKFEGLGDCGEPCGPAGSSISPSVPAAIHMARSRAASDRAIGERIAGPTETAREEISLAIPASGSGVGDVGTRQTGPIHRLSRWYSRFGIMSVAEAMRFDMLKKAAVSARSKMSSLLRPTSRKAARSSSPTR